MMIKDNKFVRYIKTAKIELIIVAAVLLLDMLSKYLISHFMEVGESKTLINKLLSFHYALNPNAAFSFDFGLSKILSQNGVRVFFMVFTGIATSVFALFMVLGVKHHKLFRISFAMIISGALGNLYDRIFVGQVRDFIEVQYFGETFFGHEYFPIFNIADSSLVVGVILFAIYAIFFFNKDEDRIRKEKEAKKAQMSTEEAENVD